MLKVNNIFFIVSFEHISHLCLVLILLSFSMYNFSSVTRKEKFVCFCVYACVCASVCVFLCGIGNEIAGGCSYFSINLQLRLHQTEKCSALFIKKWSVLFKSEFWEWWVMIAAVIFTVEKSYQNIKYIKLKYLCFKIV